MDLKKVATKTKRSGSLYDVACASAQSSSSSSAVPSGITINRSRSTSQARTNIIVSIYSAIPQVPHDFFPVFTHPFRDVAIAWVVSY